MPQYIVSYMAAVRIPGEMGCHREQVAQFDTAKPVLEVIRELGRMGAVYQEPGDLYELAGRIAKDSGQTYADEAEVSRAAFLGRQDRVNAKRHTLPARSTL